MKMEHLAKKKQLAMFNRKIYIMDFIKSKTGDLKSNIGFMSFLAFVLFTFLVPSITQGQTTVNLNPSADALIDAAASSTNYGTQNYLITHPWTSSYSRRSVIKFDLSGIPSGATITSATLKLYETGTYGYTRTINIHKLNTAWSEGSVTWASPWITAGGDYNSTASASASISWTSVLKQDSWTVTSDVQAIVNGTANNGWLVKDNNEDNSQQYWQFGSKEATSAINQY
jgi:hypothetical protein